MLQEYNHSKGEWKPKKITTGKHNLYFVWAQEGELSLDYSKNKSPIVLVPCMHLPNTDPHTELVTDEKEMEANIVLMATAPSLLATLQTISELCESPSFRMREKIKELCLLSIHQATTIKFK